MAEYHESLLQLTSKPECWEYEEEYRLIARKKDSGSWPALECSQDDKLSFKQHDLTKIILGTKFSKNHIENIREIIKDTGKEISLRKMELDPTSYSLREKEISY